MLHLLNEIPIVATLEDVLKKTLIKEEADVKIITEVYEKAKEIARPKALYREVFVEEIDGAKVTISGYRFESEVLAAVIKDVHRVYAYVCTCGTEVDDWSKTEEDYIVALWIDMIKEMFLMDAVEYFKDFVIKSYQFKNVSTIAPGSGDIGTWPIQQQVPLFKLIGDVKGEIGVELTSSLLMAPIKSVSGFLFPSDTGFANCALCTRENCQNRKVEFDKELYDKIMGKK